MGNKNKEIETLKEEIETMKENGNMIKRFGAIAYLKHLASIEANENRLAALLDNGKETNND